MQALILAAGYGKRLGKITKNIPKCLVKINSQTLIDIWLRKLHILKIDKIYINYYIAKDSKSNGYNLPVFV